MNRGRIACATSCLSLTLSLTLGLFVYAAGLDSIVAEPVEDKTTDVAYSSQADSSGQLTARFEKLLSASSMSELDRLVLVPDCTAALAAGWERVIRTVPEAKKFVAPDANAIARFLGLVEGRVRFPILEAWEAALKSAKADNHRDLLCFPLPQIPHGSPTGNADKAIWRPMGDKKGRPNDKNEGRRLRIGRRRGDGPCWWNGLCGLVRPDTHSLQTGCH